MEAGETRLTWNVSPKNGIEVFFSRDIYEKYSLSPTLSELWILSNKHEENVEASVNSVEDVKTFNTQAAAPAEEEVKPAADDNPFPEPRIPYPYVSSLTEKEQKTYLYLMTKFSKNPLSYQFIATHQREYSQYLQMKEFLNSEIAEFLKFAQNAAKSCVQDYDTISADALLYIEQFLSACIGHVKKYPEFYILHEITGIMGGKFSTELTLKLEKTLLALGKARFVKVLSPVMHTQLQLSVDYKTAASVATPEQKASALHDDISLDPNAEKLALKYCPQIVLNSQSLFTLLNNHGLNYKEQWEIPVSVKMITAEGAKPVKVIYIDSPLPKKEMTVREKNQIFHEIPLDSVISKKSTIPVSAVLMDNPFEENIFQWNMPSDACQLRRTLSLDHMNLDFDNDVTELETFGTTSKSLKTSRMENTPANICKTLSDKLKIEKQLVSTVSSGAEEETSKVNEQGFSACRNVQNVNKTQLPSSNGDVAWTDSEENSSFKGLDSDEVELNDEQRGTTTNKVLDNCTKLNTLAKTDSFRRESEVTEVNETPISFSNSDTDEERLIIDTECKNGEYCKAAVFNSNPDLVADVPKSPSPIHTSSSSLANSSESPDQEKTASKKPFKRLSKEFDPLGQILKMQTELLKPPFPKAPEQPLVNCDKSSNPAPSLVPPPSKPTVASSMEPAANTSSLPKFTWTSHFQGTPKGLLPAELKMLVEDRSEYTAPQDGNLVYKLFSLDDLLLLVRCSVQKVRTERRSCNKRQIRKHTPVYILPKVEYQAYYGVEALTESEICRLWTESLLHSKCSFYVGHIDAFTSKLIMLEEISPERLREKFGLFKPANPLNILRHILKKVVDLQEGSYLLTHTSGDSSVAIYQSCLGKVTRASYNLHKAHCSLPNIPSTLSVPWVPLDPNLPLPYHTNHGRVPCTFPPRPQEATRKQKMNWAKAHTDTPNNEKPVSMETKSNPLPAKPVRNEGVAAKKLKKNNTKQANKMKKWKKK
ncbi:little elongation complex subunit 2 isoform X2 [Chelonoidis abingdonii]|uniref:little elongation complex subunit 2 isoform X2 n=2 Tax=Chelonoidis abingdonii TaxID=106734 RepID=UPI0013F2B16E|nr:little elongation complex subunit 2 isoform X1 [Chelonoidis abingdonii]